MKPKFFTFLLIMLFTNSLSFAQNSEEIQKNIVRIEPSDQLVEALRKEISEEVKCDYFSDKLIWSIAIEEYKGGCVLNVSMSSEISKNHQYDGYFYINKYLFVVSGIIDKDLFSSKEKNSLNFNITKWGKDDVITSHIEDYSTWIYYFRNNNLSLQKEYNLPCD
ncbi:MAG: hypothetical protein RIC95_09540 [Vicingaceae bacterium]